MAGWTSLIVSKPGGQSDKKPKRDVGGELSSWIYGKVDQWENHRNQRFERRWKEYWRLWRGYWSADDRTRDSERSKLIAPALSAAIDSQVAEVSSIFDRAGWLALPDDLSDEDKADMMLTKDLLMEDLDTTDSETVFREAILNAGIFGTGIVKINTEVVTVGGLERDPETFELIEKNTERALVTHEAIRPDQFVIEPGAHSISDAMGCAHLTRKPLHWALEKSERGIFDKDVVASLAGGMNAIAAHEVDANEANLSQGTDDNVLDIIEYHGKVPVELLKTLSDGSKEDPLALLLAQDAEDGDKRVDEDTMVEAIVVIANKSYVLSAKATPFVDRSRSFVAFPWEQIPGQFWGRGLAERGYNPQKALDAELRAHIDALGFSTFPMIGVDGSRLGRGTKMEVKPGKVWVTDGNPNEVLSPFKFSGLDTANFENARSMERLVGVGTGALDLDGAQAAAGNGGVGGVGIQHASSIKRAKRAADNISRQGLKPILEITVKRYMQFEPTRYPTDFKFQVAAGMGLMARELEATQLNQAMLALPDELSSVKLTMVRGLLGNLSVDNQAEIEKAIEQALAPPDPEEQKRQQEHQQMMEQLEIRDRTAVVEEKEAKVLKLKAEAQKIAAQTQSEFLDHELKSDKSDNDSRRIELDADSNRINWESNDIQKQSLEIQRANLAQKASKSS